MQRVDDCSKLISKPLWILVSKSLFQRPSLHSAPVISRNLIPNLQFLPKKITLFTLTLALLFKPDFLPKLEFPFLSST